MRKNLLRLLAALGVLAPGCAAAQQACGLQQVINIDMRTLPDGRVSVPVTLQGRPYQLMVDTGGYISVIDALVAKELNLRTQMAGSRLVGMGTLMLNRYVTVPQIAIGGIPGKDFQFYVDPGADTNTHGQLAPHIMAAYDTELDFAGEKFSLFRHNACGRSPVYWANESYEPVPFRTDNNGHIVLELRVGGEEIDAIMDTGATRSFISMRDARRYLGIRENDPALKSLGKRNVNGIADEVFVYPFPELQFGGVTVKNPYIEIVSDRVAKNFRMIVGMGILRQLHLYIAYREKKLYLTPALARKTAN